MPQLEFELQKLRQEVNALWALVLEQLRHCQLALQTLDKDVAKAVVKQEKRINAKELNIERQCEHIIALYTPVAIDLRFVLAVLKITTSLERVGDAAKSIAKFLLRSVLSGTPALEAPLLHLANVTELCQAAAELLAVVQQAFEQEDSARARRVFLEVKHLNARHSQVHAALAEYLKQHPASLPQGLQLLLMLRKLERISDESRNISDEIVFYREAQVLRHLPGKRRPL